MTLAIAGHSFPDGREPQVCECGRRLTDILSAQREDIGKLYIAHTGVLNESEYESIERHREHIWQSMAGGG